MKKRIVVAATVLLATAGLVWFFSLHSPTQPAHKAQTTEVRAEKPTQPLVTVPASDQNATQDSVSTPVAVPQSAVADTLVDSNSADYPNGTVVSQQFTPTDSWVWSVDYNCTDNSLVIDLMILGQPGFYQTANTYHTVSVKNLNTNQFSVIENNPATYYFRVSGNCQWHITATSNTGPPYQVIVPCTLSQLYAGPGNTVPDSCGR